MPLIRNKNTITQAYAYFLWRETACKYIQKRHIVEIQKNQAKFNAKLTATF
jgi:hypothetical protein